MFDKIVSITVSIMLVLCLCACAVQKADTALEGGEPDAPVISNGGRAILQGGWLYYINGDNYTRNINERLHRYKGAICRMPQEGGEKQVVVDADVSVFNIVGDTIWYVAYEGGRSGIYSANINSTNNRRLAIGDSLFDEGGYAFCTDYLYYTVNGCLYFTDKNGSSHTQVTQYPVRAVVATQNSVYFTEYTDNTYGRLIKTDIGSTCAEAITVSGAYALGSTNGGLYYYLFDNGYCYKYNETDGTSQSVVHHTYDRYAFTDDGNYIFTANSAAQEDDEYDDGMITTEDAVYRINTVTGGKDKLCDDRAERMLYCDGWLYYICASKGYAIYRISADGSQRECVRDSMTGNLGALDIAGDWLYYFNDEDEDRVYRVNINTFDWKCIEYEG